MNDSTENNQSYHGEKGSGCLLIKAGVAFALESPLVALSKITQGLRDKKQVKWFKMDAKKLVEAIYVCYLKREGRYDLDLMLRAIAPDFETEEQTKAWIDVVIEDKYYEGIVKEWTNALYNETGAAGMKHAAEVIERVESKSRYITNDEKHFLESVESAAEAVNELPTQKAVFDAWVDNVQYYDYGRFRDTRNRLGFAWLPEARRGRKAAGR